jgi:ribosome-associated toxin RatA of RatAB toxin-antitoxin module
VLRIVLALGGVLSAGPSHAADSLRTATPEPPRQAPRVHVRGLGSRVFARAQVAVPAPPHAVYDLLCDFDRLGDFVSAIDTSRVIARDSTGVLVRQVGSTVLLVRKTVRMTLRFRPQPPQRLWFEIVAGDFRTYSGSWHVEPEAGGTRVTYDVTFTPPDLVPGPLVRHVVERDLERMLRELYAEATRRHAPSSAAP